MTTHFDLKASGKRGGVCAVLWLGFGCSGPDEPAVAGEAGEVGEAQVFLVDHENRDHHQGYALKASSGEVVELDFASNPALQPGDMIEVLGQRGLREGTTVASEVLTVDSFELLGSGSEIGTVSEALVGSGPK